MDHILTNRHSLASDALKQSNHLGGLKSIVLASSLALGLMVQPAHAALTFTFNYISPGEGFEEAGFAAARQEALNSAADMLGSYFTGYTANLTYDVTSYSSDDNTLASAGSGAYLIPGSFQQTIVQTKIISNGANDINGAGADGYIYWNFFHNWGLTDTVASDEIDFKSTAIHELLHSFGFLSFVGEGGTGLDGNSPGTADTWSVFDQFLTDASGENLIGSDGVFDPSKVGALTDGTHNDPGVLFNGTNATAANGGNPVPIFSPSPWEDGSSIAHLDDDSDVTDESIMNAYAHGTGLDIRTLGDIELGILKDIGYDQVSAVPVPAAIWLMGSGLMAMFGFSRRHKAT